MMRSQLVSLKQWLGQLKPLGLWMVPLLSVTSIPLTLSYWLANHSNPEATAPTVETLTLPPLSQLPNPVPDSPSLLNPIPLTPKTNASPQAKTVVHGVTRTSGSKTAKVTPDPLPPLPKSTKTATAASKPPSAQTTSPQAPPTHSSLTSHHHKTHSRHQAGMAPVKQAAYVPPPLEIRVGVVRGDASTVIGTSQQAYLQERTGKTLDTVAPNQSLTVVPSGSSLLINGRTMPGVMWLNPSQNSFVYVGDRWYRGRVLLVSQGNSLLAINYVDLEHYLTSVVGSEMHATAPTEALKAQAIAARSYALVHMIRPASDWYDLGDNQRWQVYKGLNSEYNTGFQAVSDTAGQVLSYQGGVVESLYASTDAIVASVHKGRGMSQLGAYELAKQGYNYQQILNRYYPGVGLARVILQQ